MPKIIDLIGKRFGKLVVVKFSHVIPGQGAVWECCCDCRNICKKRSCLLRRGATRSCGCLNRETTKIMGLKNSRHKMSYTPEFQAWADMKRRCYDSHRREYENYGGRGIKVCKRWLESFDNFLEDMGKRPSNNRSLDRIKNNGDYTPENCRWATLIQQNRNKRNTIKITFKSETHMLSYWAKKFNIRYGTLHNRIYHLKWSIKDALIIPVKK